MTAVELQSEVVGYEFNDLYANQHDRALREHEEPSATLLPASYGLQEYRNGWGDWTRAFQVLKTELKDRNDSTEDSG